MPTHLINPHNNVFQKGQKKKNKNKNMNSLSAIYVSETLLQSYLLIIQTVRSECYPAK